MWVLLMMIEVVVHAFSGTSPAVRGLGLRGVACDTIASAAALWRCARRSRWSRPCKIKMQAHLDRHIDIDSSFPGLRQIHESPDIYLVDDLLAPQECDDIIQAAKDKGLDLSPVAYAGWTEDAGLVCVCVCMCVCVCVHVHDYLKHITAVMRVSTRAWIGDLLFKNIRRSLLRSTGLI
jgi:hypothetical protein